jgi:phosphoglycerate dehydrogenase-like enzyme/predicted dehydrogenase
MLGFGMHPVTPSTRPIRALVIGAGPATVQMHLPVLAKLRDEGRVSLVAVCDIIAPRAVAASRQFGFLEHTGDASAALRREDIDAVYIFASAQLHFEYGSMALNNAKHLFVEKPIAQSYAQAIALADAARGAELVAVGGHNRRFYKSLELVRSRAGQSGWRAVEAIFHKAEFGKTVPFGATSWLTANGIHALDAMLFMMGGLPANIAAAAAENAGAANMFSALMQWSTGAQGTFSSNNDAGGRREEYVFHGVAETYRVTDSDVIIEKNGTRESISIQSIGDGIAEEHRSFLEAISTGAPAPHSLSRLAPSLFLAELIESGYCGSVVQPRRESFAIRASRPSRGAILVDNPAAPPLPLAGLMPDYRIISVQEVERSENSHPEIVAAILAKGAGPLHPAVLSKLPNLTVVGIAGLSLRPYQPELLLARGVALINASGAYANSVGEFALGLAILGRRKAFSSNALMRVGGWGSARSNSRLGGGLRRAAHSWRPVLRKIGVETTLLRVWRATSSKRATPHDAIAAAELRNCLVGIIGWGDNARAFAAALLRLGARVLVYSEHAAENEIRDFGALAGSLGEILAADIVSLHRGLTPATRYFLGDAELAKLRPGSVLINVARGALIEPHALLRRLRGGDIFACLDTFEEEPLPANHPLRRMPNVFLTSHIAGGSPSMHVAAAEEVVRKVVAYLGGDSSSALSADRLHGMT